MKELLLNLVMGALIHSAAAAPHLDTEPAKPSIVLGTGNALCEKWTEDRLANRHAYKEDVTWFLGYVSAYNKFLPDSKNPFHAQDKSNLTRAMDRGCLASPKTKLVEEVNTVLNSTVPNGALTVAAGSKATK